MREASPDETSYVIVVKTMSTSQPVAKPWIVLLCQRCASSPAMGRHQRQLGEVRSNDDVTVFHRWGSRETRGRVQTRVVAVTVHGPDFQEFSCRGCGARFKYREAEILSMAGRARKAGETELLLRPNLGRPRS